MGISASGSKGGSSSSTTSGSSFRHSARHGWPFGLLLRPRMPQPAEPVRRHAPGGPGRKPACESRNWVVRYSPTRRQAQVTRMAPVRLNPASRHVGQQQPRQPARRHRAAEQRPMRTERQRGRAAEDQQRRAYSLDGGRFDRPTPHPAPGDPHHDRRNREGQQAQESGRPGRRCRRRTCRSGSWRGPHRRRCSRKDRRGSTRRGLAAAPAQRAGTTDLLPRQGVSTAPRKCRSSYARAKTARAITIMPKRTR